MDEVKGVAIKRHEILEATYLSSKIKQHFKLMQGYFSAYDFFLGFEDIEVVQHKELGLPQVGDSTHLVGFAKLKLAFRRYPGFKKPSLNPIFDIFFESMGISGEFMKIVNEFLDSDPEEDTIIEIPVAFKKDYAGDIFRERIAYMDLSNNGIETLSVVFPYFVKGDENLIKKTAGDLLMTFVEKGRPVNSYSLDYLLAKDSNDWSILDGVVTVLGKMHSKNLIHGDSQLRNFLFVQDDNRVKVIPIDLELYLNFNKLNLSDLNTLEAEILGRYPSFNKTVDLDILRSEAMLDDISRVVEGLTYQRVLNDESVEQIKIIFDEYINLLKRNRILEENGYLVTKSGVLIPFESHLKELLQKHLPVH